MFDGFLKVPHNIIMKQTRKPSLELVHDSKVFPKRRPLVTSYDVAKRAGVSQSAVSRCFKPGASVSKKMRERVMKAVEEMGYQPNAIARSLITRRSNLVGVILSDFTSMYNPEVIFELNQSFSNRGEHVLLFTLHHERDIDEMIDIVFQYQVDGVVIATTLSPERVDWFEERNIPLVFFNSTIPDRTVNSVLCDQAAGERVLVNALINAGHKSFGIISGPEDSLVSIQRTAGARDHLVELGFDHVPLFVGDYTYESGQRGARELVNRFKSKLDAIICANDVMAIGCMDTLRKEFSLKIPDDISVVGFDGIAPAIWSGYNVTTIKQPMKQMSEAAVEMIMERVDHPDKAPEMRVFTGVMLNGSSARIS